MSIDLSEYSDLLEASAPELRETFEANLHEAARVMSPAGVRAYLEGARALHNLGRGSELVSTYLEEMPEVARAVGDQVIDDTVAAAMRLASMASGEVIGLVLASLPTAARRLGDADLLRQYLHLVHQLSAKAPRGLRPMLSHIDQLLSRLTLGGLRRWAMWGAQAHGRDLKLQAAYFGLETADSQKVLQGERRGTLFVDAQRRLGFYLRALWGRDFAMRPTAGDLERGETPRPYIEAGVIHVPDAYDDTHGVSGIQIYRAACAHAAAHIAYTKGAVPAEGLNPAQRFLVGLFEDARVEALAMASFPGLKALWRPLIGASPGEASCDPVVERLERLALAMLEPAREDSDPLIGDMAQAFRSRLQGEGDGRATSRALGLELYERLTLETGLPSLRVMETLRIPYRDDNRYIWEADEIARATAEVVPAGEQQVRRRASVMEMVNELDTELAGEDAQEVWTLETEFFRDGDPEGVSINQLEGKEPVSQPYHYSEWDYQARLYRPDWTTVVERRQPRGDPAILEQVMDEYRALASRIRHIIDALVPQGVVRVRHQEDGDDLDIDAAIRAMVDLRMGDTPDPRVNIRYKRQTRDLAVMVLLDLSESTNDTLGGSDRPVIQLTREATTLLAWAMDGIGDPFAVHGFASDTRHDVHYYRFKDFGQAYDERARARMAGMQGGLSTRMGAAMRHAARLLGQQPQQKRLLLLVSDGEPADIDVRDPQYLRYDAKQAVEELGASGIRAHCLTLDRHADEYVGRIFGPHGYTVVDHVQRLPERLPTLFATLTS